MTSPQKRRGDKAELDVQTLLRNLLDVPARRALGAGRLDDVGDIHGIPDTIIQVAAYQDLARAVREKLPTLEPQRANAGAAHAALFVRRRGGRFVVVLTPELWAALWLAAMRATLTEAA